MDADQQIARDRHVEVIASIKDLRDELTATRLEVKTDLITSRTEYLTNLATHSAADEVAFAEIRKDISALKNWKTRTATLGSIGVLVLTTATAFLPAALASGKL